MESIKNDLEHASIENVYQPPQSSFTCTTVDVSAIFTLMYGLGDLMTKLHLLFTPQGVRLSEFANDYQINLSSFWFKDNFEYYECPQPVTICFHPVNMYTILSSHHQRDTMTWTFNHKKPQYLQVKINAHGENKVVRTFEIKLYRSTMEITDAHIHEVGYALGFNTTILTSIISNLDTFEVEPPQVHIKCDASDMSFMTVDNNSIVRQARIRLRISNTQNKNRAPPIYQTFSLKILTSLLKCFSINKGFVMLYLARNYPLKFGIKVGTLGELNIAVMFETMDDEHQQYIASCFDHLPEHAIKSEPKGPIPIKLE